LLVQEDWFEPNFVWGGYLIRLMTTTNFLSTWWQGPQYDYTSTNIGNPSYHGTDNEVLNVSTTVDSSICGRNSYLYQANRYPISDTIAFGPNGVTLFQPFAGGVSITIFSPLEIAGLIIFLLGFLILVGAIVFVCMFKKVFLRRTSSAVVVEGGPGYSSGYASGTTTGVSRGGFGGTTVIYENNTRNYGGGGGFTVFS